MPRLFILIHRWLGVVVCLFMAAWFASGAVLVYVPFPSLPQSDRLEQTRVADTSLQKLSPADAIRALGAGRTLDRLRLTSRGGRPLYILQARGQAAAAIWADDGQTAAVQSLNEADGIASGFSGERVETIEGPIDFDQWTVHQGFDAERPYFRAHLGDAAGTILYVSQLTGEVLQRTTRFQRAWNYAGAVVHWIYPTVLRRHWAAWDRLVWWLSLAGVAVVLLGAAVGVDQMMRSLRARPGRISVYRGWMKWHHVMGLFVFMFVLTWIFSGWLSMDHGRIFSMPDATAQQVDRFRGLALEEAAREMSPQAIRTLGPFREVEIKAIASTPVMIVRAQAGQQGLYSLATGQRYPGDLLPTALIADAVQAAWPQSRVVSVEQPAVDDVYRQVRQDPLPLTTMRVKLSDPDETWVHVDAASGEIVSVMDRSRRMYRWLYHGLHSLDFPGLAERRPLWDIVVLALLATGLLFSITGVYLGVRRLRRSLTKPAGPLAAGNGLPQSGSTSIGHRKPIK